MYVRLRAHWDACWPGAALAVSGAVIQTVLANPAGRAQHHRRHSARGWAWRCAAQCCRRRLPRCPLRRSMGAFAGVMLVLLISEKAGGVPYDAGAGRAWPSPECSGRASTRCSRYSRTPSSAIRISASAALANLSMGKVAPAAWVILLCLGAALALANEMDVLALGADTARSLGLRVRGVRVALLALAAALAGAAVSFAGLLGFVGLVAPHMVRRLVGGESRRLLAAARWAARRCSPCATWPRARCSRRTSCRWASCSPSRAGRSSSGCCSAKGGDIHDRAA